MQRYPVSPCATFGARFHSAVTVNTRRNTMRARPCEIFTADQTAQQATMHTKVPCIKPAAAASSSRFPTFHRPKRKILLRTVQRPVYPSRELFPPRSPLRRRTVSIGAHQSKLSDHTKARDKNSKNTTKNAFSRRRRKQFRK